MSREFDVLVIGAGVTAMTVATVLIARKLVSPGRVAVVAESIAAPSAVSLYAGGDLRTDWDTRVFALSRSSQRLLEVCGAWHALAGRTFAYERMCVWDARGEAEGEGSLTFDCAELNEPNLGFIVEGRALQRAATLAAAAAGVIFIDAQILDLATTEADVRVRLSDGRDMRGQLLIAADGTESRTRDMLRIETAGHTYNQDALVAHVRTARSHRNTAWQRFLNTGPLAFLPLPDGLSSIVWSADRPEAARLRALDTAAFNEALTLASDGVLGKCEIATPIASFPLKLQYALDYVRPRAVLVGDAAHVVHPLAGQGLNLGLLDCASLVEILSEGGAGCFGEQKLLRRYERRRRSENLVTAAALDGLERLFASDNELLSRLRMSGLAAVSRVPFLKRQLTERALGIGGDTPAFLD
jgi:2-octaprenylphenol hydroxylase